MYEELRENPFGHGFADIIDRYDWDETVAMVDASTDADVRRVLTKAAANRVRLTPEDFARIRAVGGRVATVYADLLEFFYQYHKALGYPGGLRGADFRSRRHLPGPDGRSEPPFHSGTLRKDHKHVHTHVCEQRLHQQVCLLWLQP